MQLHEGYLDNLISWLDTRKDVGIVGCKLINASYKTADQLRPLKFPRLAPYLPAFLGFKPFFCTVNPRFFYPDFNDDLEQEVEFLRGAFMLIEREVIDKIGFGFDPSYFLLLEDVDLCQTVKKLWYKIVYTPQMSCIDFFHQSFSKEAKPWKYLCMVKSFKTYVKKWHSPWHLLWIYPITLIGFILRIPEWGWAQSIKAIYHTYTLHR
jgi:GT2 family glycosyltransferase